MKTDHTQRRPRVGLLTGKFQPVSLADAQSAMTMLAQCDIGIMVNGSIDRARDPRFPFDLADRRAMWRESLPADIRGRMVVLGQRDMGNTARWASAVDALVVKAASDAGFDPDDTDFVIYGTRKDSGSSYLDDFPGYELVELPTYKTPDPARLRGTMPYELDAADIRKGMFETGRTPMEAAWLERVLLAVTPGVRDIIRDFIHGDEFPRLQEEYRRAKATANLWKVRETRDDEGVPYSPNFNSVDPVAIHGNKILMHQRENYPGKGMWALPGVILRSDETIVDAAVRALVDKTGIDMTAGDLRRAIVDQWCEDSLQRSVRDRTLTHPVLFQLGPAKPGPGGSRARARALPRTRASDRVRWFTPDEIEGMRTMIHEDHAVIIDKALARLRPRY